MESAQTSEATVRRAGAVPATVAVIQGKIKVGLDEKELSLMAETPNIPKVSRRDLPMILASRQNGATTVSTTMIGAGLAGIKVFATGGIGGVHRGGEKSFDISADLRELAQTDVAVVCAGAKSILDIGLTLEVLETYGVPVIGYHTADFPGFYVRDSGFRVDYQADDADVIARCMDAKWRLGLSSGLVVANPIPKEHEMDPELVCRCIDEALLEAEKQNISGKEVTPFLLAKLYSISGGETLKSNKALVYNNARVAGLLAAAYSRV